MGGCTSLGNNVQKDGGNIILNGDPETLIAFPLEKKISGL
jgi:hypothetical protein